MATPTTGTARCSYCATNHELVMQNKHVVSGPLIRDLDTLLRLRDESKDPQVDKRTGKPAAELEPDEVHDAIIATVPRSREVEIDGLVVRMPSGFRPAFRHDCPTVGHVVTLYADTEGGSVQ